MQQTWTNFNPHTSKITIKWEISYQDYTEKEEYLDKNNSLTSGDLIEVKIKTPAIHQNDEKTGAIIVEIY